MSHLYLHGFGVRYGLPVPLALYLYAAGAVVVVSFVLVVMFARGRVGEHATDYPRWRAPWLVALGNSFVVRFLAGLIGLVGNFWTYLNPFTTIYRLLARVVPHGGRPLPAALGIWPAGALYFAFAWL